jgi:hypothetical protein
VSIALLAACGPAAEPSRDPASATPDSALSARPEMVAAMPVDLDSLPRRPGVTVRAVVIRRDTTTYGTGPAVATLSTGDTVVLADSAIRAWRLGGGRLVAVSGRDGAGGYENEGESVTVIDPASGLRRRVVADYFAIVRVELASDAGRDALLVHMRDGGRGALHVTVADAARGQVFRMRNAVARVDGPRVIVASYGDGELAVDFGETRRPLRVDTIAVAAVDTMALLVVPRAPQ